METHYFNPYAAQTFFSFFAVLLQRLSGFISGSLGWNDLAADEIQLLVLTCVSASSALVGTFLILRKMTMLANSISHTILLGIVLAYLATRGGLIGDQTEMHHEINLAAMLWAALLTGIATSFLTEFLTKVAKLQEDASTGLVFTSLFALGVVLVTLLTRSSHIGLEVVMGNADGLQKEDCKLVFIILALNIGLFSLFYKEYLLTTFDSGLAKVLGFSPLFFNYLLMVQVSSTVVGAFRAVGVLMVLAFITGPVLTARLMTHRLKTLLILAAVLGMASSWIGVAFSRHILTRYDMALSTGGLVVCVIVILYIVALAGFQVSKQLFLKPNPDF